MTGYSIRFHLVRRGLTHDSPHDDRDEYRREFEWYGSGDGYRQRHLGCREGRHVYQVLQRNPARSARPALRLVCCQWYGGRERWQADVLLQHVEGGMSGFLKQSTASQSRAIGPFLDDTDFKTAETALTIANTDIKLIVNGGASPNN